MEYKCELIEREEQFIVSVRTKSAVENLPKLFGETYVKLMSYLSEINEYPNDAPFAIYYNLDMADLDIEIGFPVAREVEERDDMQPNIIPKGKYITCMHIGAYSKMEYAYFALKSFAKENGYETEETAYEFYLNGPDETTEDNYKTRIIIPVK